MFHSTKNFIFIGFVILFSGVNIGTPANVACIERYTNGKIHPSATLDVEDEFDDPPNRIDSDIEGVYPGLDEAEEEFDDQDNTFIASGKKSAPNLFISVVTSLKKDSILTLSQEIACHTDDTDRITLNRTSLQMQWEHLFAFRYFVRFDGKAAYNAAYDYLDYPERTRGHYRFFTRVYSLFLQTGSRNNGFKLGQQIVVWGEADGAVVTDVISPRDFTESVFTRIEDARLGQMLIKADRYTDSGQWTLLLNPDPQVNIYAEPGHEYAAPPLTGTFENNNIGIEIIPEAKPSHSLEDTEIGGRWKKTFGKSDLSIMAATTLNNSPVLESRGISLQENIILRPVYPRYTMIGAAANRALGNFLFKGELACKLGRRFNHINLLADHGLVEKNVVDAALGLDYDANGAWQATVEISEQHILNWDSAICFVRRDETGLYFNWSKDFLNQTLNTQYTWYFQIKDSDSMHRFETTYDINDQWKLKFGVTLFDIRHQTSQLGVFKDRHRIAAQVEVSF